MQTQKMWAILLHLGTNMWRKKNPFDKSYQDEESSIYRDFLYTDKETWTKVVDFLPSCGINTVLIDLGEGVQYDSHPELAVKGSWTKAELRAELDRIRSLGMTPLPKLNFSAGHNAWMQDHAYTVGTDHYNQVCKDLIEEVIDLFDTPELIHLGMDEETVEMQARQPLAIVRPYYTMIRDCNFLFDVCRAKGVRPWIWIDKDAINGFGGEEKFRNGIPKDVLLSNWYYSMIPYSDDICEQKEAVALFKKLEDWGYEQVPTCSTYAWYLNDKQMMYFAAHQMDLSKVRGFMTAPWCSTQEQNWTKIENSLILMGEAAKKHGII